jgi:transcriptional regulator with XRE-family HTH domain
MMIGTRLRQLRNQKGLSQGDIENSTGLLRCYISRVENGHTVPSLETLERFAAALDVPMYQLFFDNEETASTPHLTPRQSLEELMRDDGKRGHDARFLFKLRTLVERIGQPEREVLLILAKKLATR